MSFLTILVTTVSLFSSAAVAATSLQAVVYGTFAFTLHGDRTPYVLPNPSLTPYGAQQMYAVGSQFRSRYVNPPSSTSGESSAVQGISAYQISNEEISILTFSDQFYVASAQAFLQGLYPPVEPYLNYTFINGESELSNGSNIDFPLNGYQYPQLYTASEVDLNSIWVAGNLQCPEYTSSRSEYFASADYEKLLTDTNDFYFSLLPEVLSGVFSNASIGFFDAYYIYDYLNYQVTHNSTVAAIISADTLTQARTLADKWVFAMNGNLTAYGNTEGDHIRAIAGRTLASEIARAMYTNVNTEGAVNKMMLLFGSFEPMVAFASLAGLATQETSQFFGQPLYGSSMVFELFAYESDTSSSYPSMDDLRVRFLFQNGSDASLQEYPLFGRDPSENGMPFNEFMTSMDNTMILSIAEWCNTCSSSSVFCPAFTENSGSTGSTGTCVINTSKGMKPVVAGVIGAIVALIVAAVLTALGMLIGGIRFYRTRTKRRSELNGFKGAEKLASDPDLSVAKTGVGATVVSADENVRGHERVGSWEMGQTKAKEVQIPPRSLQPRASFEDDDIHVSPFADPVKADERV